MIHSKVDLKITNFTGTFSAVDYFRFRGTCVVEHWDILQQITGDETNPMAYF
jgi:predicted SnoaL-like aldol condensation-catalyzing enzyme